MRTFLGIALCAAIAAPIAGAAAEAPVVTSFAILVGFPSGDEAAGVGSLLVPGTVIPLAEDGAAPAAPDSKRLVERSVAFSRVVDRLWSTFRLDRERLVQRGATRAASLERTLDLPAPPGAEVRIAATLVGYDETTATYRVVFRQSEKTIADSTVAVSRGGRAVVGGTDGPGAPYLFVVIEPETDRSAEDGIPRAGKDSGLTAPAALGKVPPRYPEEARKRRVQGVVVVDAVIGADGTIRDVRVLEEPDPLLGEAAAAAVRQWTFAPARRADGTPVEVRSTFTVDFSLR